MYCWFKIFSFRQPRSLLTNIFTCFFLIALCTTAMPGFALAVRSQRIDNSQLPNNQTLAPQSIFQESELEKQIKRLIKIISLSGPQEMQRLAYEIGIMADIHLSIQQCLIIGRAVEAAEIALNAINDKVEGVRGKVLIRALDDCFAKEEIYREKVGIALRAMESNVDCITGDVIARWMKDAFTVGEGIKAGDIAVGAIRYKVKGVSSALVIGWIDRYFAEGWPDQAGKIALEAIKNKVEGVNGTLVIRAINESFAYGDEERARELALWAIWNKTEGITDDMIMSWKLNFEEDAQSSWWYPYVRSSTLRLTDKEEAITGNAIRRSIEECFEKRMPGRAGQFALKAFRAMKISRKTARIFDLLRSSELLGMENLYFSAEIVAFAIENGRLNDLSAIFESGRKNKRILPVLDLVGSVIGYGHVVQEVYEGKGVESFAKIYDSIYPHLYDDVLPADVDLNDPKTIAILDHLTHFSQSKFAREDLTLPEIYMDYMNDYKSRKIEPLPEGLPPARVIEVATKRSQGLTEDVRKYYREMMRIVGSALVSLREKETTIYASCLTRLKNAISAGIAILEQKKTETTLPEIAQRHMAEQIKLLQETVSKLDVGSDKEGFPVLLLEAKHLKAVGKLAQGNALIQEMLITCALASNAMWQQYFDTVVHQEASQQSIRQFVSFVERFIGPHILGTVQATLREEFLRRINLKIFKEEIDRTGEISEFRRRIRLTPCRGWLAEFVGYYSDECWTRTRYILRDNPEAIVMILSDEETQDILGGTLLVPNAVNEENTLIDRGLSPRTEVTSNLSMEDFMEQIGRYEEEIARTIDAKSILVPFRQLQPGLGTNNPDVIQYYERVLEGRPALNLDQEDTFNGYDITRKCCVVFREVLPAPIAENKKGNTRLDQHIGGAGVPYAVFVEDSSGEIAQSA